jgi:hypothetical protein
MSQYKKDYEFGKLKEKELKEKLEKYFSDTLLETTKRYDKYDFKGDNYYYELKSRNCKYNKYPTTLIPVSKLFTDNQRFIFSFVDGDYYIEYSSEFENFEKQQFVRNFRTGYKDIKQEYIFIPIDKLKPIYI